MEGRAIYTLQAHENSVNALVFSQDGEFFASAGADRRVIVWKSNFAKEKLTELAFEMSTLTIDRQSDKTPIVTKDNVIKN